MEAGAERRVMPWVRGSEGAITGTVVCAAAIAYSAGSQTSTTRLCIAIVGTAFVYWLAHLHARTLASAMTHEHHPIAALRLELRETWSILAAAVPPVVVLVAFDVFGADLADAAWAALWTTIALLVVYSYVAGARGGLDRWGRFWSAVLGGLLGLVVVAFKVALH